LFTEYKHIFFKISLILLITVFSQAQENISRGSIPEELLRPSRGEAPRYPIDTVIGELGQGRASQGAYTFANSISAGLLSGQIGHPALVSINPILREKYLYSLAGIAPRSFRLGGGREEADGAVSFLVRFIGREYGITGELYIRYVTRQVETAGGEVTQLGSWQFDELILEDAKSRNQEMQEPLQLLNFLPYERFF
jgi:hypothetical protein